MGGTAPFSSNPHEHGCSCCPSKRRDLYLPPEHVALLDYVEQLLLGSNQQAPGFGTGVAGMRHLATRQSLVWLMQA